TGKIPMPSLVNLAPKATTSGTGVAEAESSSVFNPVLMGAGSLFAQSKLNCTSVGAIGALGVSAKTKLCVAPAPTFTGVFAEPVTWLVAGSVVWYVNVAGRLVIRVSAHAIAVSDPALMSAANAVAVVPP